MINNPEKINNLIKKLNQIPDEVWLEAIKEVEEENMNEDKELEEAKSELLWFSHIDVLYGNTYCMTIEQLNKIQEAIEVALEALKNKETLIYKLESGEDFTSNQVKFIEKNFIPKKKIEDKIKELKKKKDLSQFGTGKIEGLQELLENK